MIQGIWSAAITPVDAGYAPDAARAIPYYRDLLAAGCDGINLLGTTGQAMSFDVASRIGLMESIRASGLPGKRFICGTGAASLQDAIALTRAVSGVGFTAALVMPPFFYRDAPDDGILRFFDALLNATQAPVLLYHFPKMSGIAFHPALVTRLTNAFPERIVGIKDSSSDAAYQQTVIAEHPELAILPGSEATLLDALSYGATGCISGSVALWPDLAQTVYRERNPETAAKLAAQRGSLEGKPLIPQVHARVAHLRGDDAWLRLMPPL